MIAAASSALSVSGLHVAYQGVPALGGIDLEIGRGEFVALLGPSGCGKTSLLRTIAGFVAASRGTVLLDGEDIARLPPRDRNIGIVFQSYALFPHMSVLENVLFGLQCRKVPPPEALARARAVIALVGLSPFAERRPKQLSGGQQQRVALARAVVVEPKLLLLDEPLGALDRQLRIQMQTELRSLQRKLGVTTLFVTHDQEEAMSLADRIAVMRAGVIEQVATPHELFRQPNSAWTCEFMGAGNLVEGPVVPAGPGVVRLDLGPGLDVTVRPPGPVGATVLVQVPFDRARLAATDGPTGLAVVGRRFLGATVEIHVGSPAGLLRAHMPAEEASPFEVGRPVVFAAGPADTRLMTPR